MRGRLQNGGGVGDKQYGNWAEGHSSDGTHGIRQPGSPTGMRVRCFPMSVATLSRNRSSGRSVRAVAARRLVRIFIPA